MNKLKKFRVESHINNLNAPKGAPPGIFTFDRIDDELKTNQTYHSYRDLIKTDPPLPSTLQEFTNPRQYIDAYWKIHATCDPHQKPIERYAYAWNGSIFDDRIQKLNLSKISNALSNLSYRIVSQGVNRSILLISGKGTSFPWHLEDRNLASILYHHFGADKYWVFIHTKSRFNFEAKIKADFEPFEPRPCANPLKHKRYITDLKWLDDHEIEYSIVSVNSHRYLCNIANLICIVTLGSPRGRKLYHRFTWNLSQRIQR